MGGGKGSSKDGVVDSDLVAEFDFFSRLADKAKAAGDALPSASELR